MGSENRTWGAKLRPDQHKAMSDLVDERGISKSDAVKQSVDAYLDERNSTDLTNYEDAVLDGAVFSAIGTIAATAAAAFGLVAWAPGLQLAGVLAATAVASVLIVQQGVLRGDE